jgi:hypothetical protein
MVRAFAPPVVTWLIFRKYLRTNILEAYKNIYSFFIPED